MLVRQAAWTFATRILVALAGFTTSVLTARWLGPSGKGEYFFIITLANFVIQFGAFGLHSSNVYFVAKNATLLGRLTINSLWVSLVTGTVGAVIAILLVRYGFGARHIDVGALWFIAALAPANLFLLLGTNLLLGSGRVVTFNALQAAQYLGAVILIGLAGWVGLSLYGFLAATSVVVVLSAVTLLYVLWNLCRPELKFDRYLFFDGLGYAFKAYLAALLPFVVLRSNVFLLQSSAGSAEVGYFSIALQVLDALTLLPASVSMVLFPALVRESEGRWSTTVYSLLVIAGFMAVICALFGFFAEPFIRIAFGVEYLPAVTTLKLALPAAFFLGLISVISQFLAALGIPWQLLAAWVGAVGTVIGLSSVLTPRFASAGASASLSITYALTFLAVFALAYFISLQFRTTKAKEIP